MTEFRGVTCLELDFRPWRTVAASLALAAAALVSGCTDGAASSDGGSTSAAESSTSVEGSSGLDGTSTESSSGAEASTLVPDSTSSSTSGPEDSTTGGRPSADPGCPECIVLVDELVSGRGLAVDDTHVYFTDQSQGTISRILKGGGDGGIIVDGQDSPYGIAVDAEHVYWTNRIDNGAVLRAPKEGGRAEVVAMAMQPRAVAVDETHVYWGAFGSEDEFEDDGGGVYRRVLGLDGPQGQLASMFGGISALVLGDGQLYWTAHAESVGSFIEDPNEQPIGGVFSAVLDGTADPANPTILATDQAQPWGIARTPNGQLLWANGDGEESNRPNTVMTASADGPVVALESGSGAPWGVAADATFAYWTDNDRVTAFPLDGDEAIQLAEQQNGARSIAVDDDDVFWITRTRVLQRPKPVR